MADDVVISVCTLTYNHEKYIAKAIESVLAQKCSYTIEMIISDDCSTDGTVDIIKKYAALHPHIIKPIFNTTNLGSKKNNAQCIMACRGKYIAGLEGDDYWIDPYKLQKQIDFLEANADYSLCFTDAIVVDEHGIEKKSMFRNDDQTEFGMKDILETEIVFIPTASMVFRNILPKSFPQYIADAMSGDIALHIFFADKGRIKKLNEKSSAYRVHPGGITKSAYQLEHAFNAQFDLYEAANEYLNFRHFALFNAQLFKMAKTRLIYGTKELTGMKRQKQILKYLRKYFKYADSIDLKEIFYYLTILYLPFLLRKKKAD